MLWRPRRQACSLEGEPSPGETASVLFRILGAPHLQQLTTLANSDRPRWLSRTPSVTQIQSIHEAWKARQDSHANFLGGLNYAVAFSLCCCASTE